MRTKNSFLTAEQFILREQQRRHPHASGEFSWLLAGITLATKYIAATIRRGRLVDVLGATEETNVQGESVQKLDVLANQTLLSCLGNRGNVGILASEENEEPTVVLQDREYGKYVVIFDPLDGSSNIDVNVSVGTIFSILRRDTDGALDRKPLSDVLQRGTRQVAAGYVLYSASTMLVFSTGEGVHCFTLDPSIGAYILTHDRLRLASKILGFRNLLRDASQLL
jgi:fructose-1,6-bisphosphatase I